MRLPSTSVAYTFCPREKQPHRGFDGVGTTAPGRQGFVGCFQALGAGLVLVEVEFGSQCALPTQECGQPFLVFKWLTQFLQQFVQPAAYGRELALGLQMPVRHGQDRVAQGLAQRWPRLAGPAVAGWSATIACSCGRTSGGCAVLMTVDELRAMLTRGSFLVRHRQWEPECQP